jgi:hypothetical protein
MNNSIPTTHELMVFPEEELIAVFTMSDILEPTEPEHEFVSRVLRRWQRVAAGRSGNNPSVAQKWKDLAHGPADLVLPAVSVLIYLL